MTVKQVNPTTFEVDPEYFIKEVDSLGNFFDSLPLVGTAYQNGSPIGIRVGNLEKQDIGSMLGLHPYDIIVAINDVKTVVKLATPPPQKVVSLNAVICGAKLGAAKMETVVCCTHPNGLVTVTV